MSFNILKWLVQQRHGFEEQQRQAIAEYAQHPEFTAYAAQAAQAFAEQQAAYAAAQVRELEKCRCHLS